MLQETSPTINPAVSIENDPVFSPQKSQELSLTSSVSSQSIEKAAARIAAASATALPDLTITAHTMPTSFYAGDNVSNFTYTVKNSGTAKAGASTTKFWLSKDKNWDASDDLLGQDSVNTLDFGKSTVESASFKTDAKLAAGKYYVLMEADGAYKVTESNEKNNFLAAPVTIKSKQPDLFISTTNAPDSADAGDKITLKYTLKNEGTADAGKHHTKVYLSKDGKIDSKDTLLLDVNESVLKAGKSRSVSKSATLDSNLAGGTYYVLYSADANTEVAESDEKDNLAAAEKIAIKGLSKPDLSMSFSSPPSIVAAGESFNLGYALKNSGNLEAGVSTTKFYLSKDTLVDASDIVLGDNSEAKLGAGKTFNGTELVNIGTSVTAGDYYLIGVADAKGQVGESNETNNNVSSKITITGSPDLSFSKVTAPSSGTAGSSINLTYTLKNGGTGAAGLHTSGFYLSTDTILDESDVQLDTNAEDVLAAGKSRAGTGSGNLPSNLKTGDYYILFSADDQNGIVESNEDNNVSSTKIEITGIPDLTVSSVTAPSTARPGETITIDYTEQNLGGVADSYHSTYFYLSTDDAFDLSTDTYLTGISDYDGIAAMGSQNGSVTANLSPSLAAGSYYIFGVSDAYNYLAEGNENNNVSAPQAITIAGEPIAPDLTFSYVSEPYVESYYDYYEGSVTSIFVDYTELNQGDGFADYHYNEMYLSEDQFFDPDSDYFVGDNFAYSLAAGASQSSTIDGYVIYSYDDLPEGYYHVILVNDAYNEVAESDESNNTWSSDSQYYIPNYYDGWLESASI